MSDAALSGIPFVVGLGSPQGDDGAPFSQSPHAGLLAPVPEMVAIPTEADQSPRISPAGQDFDGDGQADLIWLDPSMGEVALRLMDQGVKIRRDQFVKPMIRDQRWKVRGSGNFNDDGFADLLWHNGATGQVVVWLLNAGQPLRAAALPPETDRSWQILSVGNFDGDLQADDLLWYNPQTGDRRVWLMDGTTRQGNPIPIEPQTAAPGELLGIGDFDNNGTSDLLWREPNNDLTIWKMNGTQRTESVLLEGERAQGNTPARTEDWSILAIGDFENRSGRQQPDGHIDILWQHPGGRSYWTLEGTSLVAEKFFFGDLPVPIRLNIEFDYRFDSGWFSDDTDPQARQRREVLEAAARVWGEVLRDEFEDIPVGTPTPFVRDPEEPDPQTFITTPGQRENIFVTDQPIDDLVVFVGSRSLGSGGELGRAGSSGFFVNEPRYTSTRNFEPWLGNIMINRDVDWYFGLTPPDSNDPVQRQQSDLLSTVVHELGHILGFSRNVAAFKSQLSGDRFVGPNALARTNGLGIPLEEDESSHIKNAFELNGSGETALDPVSLTGKRQLPTVLDLAIFDDIGYEVNYSRAAQNPSDA